MQCAKRLCNNAWRCCGAKALAEPPDGIHQHRWHHRSIRHCRLLGAAFQHLADYSQKIIIPTRRPWVDCLLQCCRRWCWWWDVGEGGRGGTWGWSAGQCSPLQSRCSAAWGRCYTTAPLHFTNSQRWKKGGAGLRRFWYCELLYINATWGTVLCHQSITWWLVGKDGRLMKALVMWRRLHRAARQQHSTVAWLITIDSCWCVAKHWSRLVLGYWAMGKHGLWPRPAQGPVVHCKR
jgi:hypothetical protein